MGFLKATIHCHMIGHNTSVVVAPLSLALGIDGGRFDCS